MISKRQRMVLSIVLFLVLLLFGCSSDNDTSQTPTNNEENNLTNIENNNNDDNSNEGIDNNLEDDLEPVTLLMVTHWGDGQFEENFKQHVEEALPHITLEHVQSRQDELEENVFAKNLKPDIMMASVTDYLIEIDLLLDLYPLIEKFGFDLGRLEPGIMDYLKNMSHEGELNGLPLIRPEYALVYNPDIFDLFGVSYPRDGMTWEEVIDLAREVTNQINDVHYRGFHPGDFDFMMRQIPTAEYVDPETHEPTIADSEPFRIYLERLEATYNIPGNMLESPEGDDRAVNMLRRGELAMAADRAFAGAYVSNYVDSGVNFDFVTYPIWGGEYGSYGPNEPGNGLVITNITEHPEDAFRVVEYLLSDEYQMWQASTGNLPAVITSEVREAFMRDHEHYDILKEKNLEAIISMEAAPIPIKSQYESEILDGTDYREGLYHGEDINTIIRKMQDQAEANAKDILSRQ